MDAWLVPVSCAGSCQLTNITLSLAHGEVTTLIPEATSLDWKSWLADKKSRIYRV
jgi:hypothetical protein